MIQIVMKPEPAPTVRGEGLYRAVFNCEDLGLHIRAKNAREAERKLMIVFRHELKNKSVDFKAEDYLTYDKEESNGEETEKGHPEGDRITDSDRSDAPGAD